MKKIILTAAVSAALLFPLSPERRAFRRFLSRRDHNASAACRGHYGLPVSAW